MADRTLRVQVLYETGDTVTLGQSGVLDRELFGVEIVIKDANLLTREEFKKRYLEPMVHTLLNQFEERGLIIKSSLNWGTYGDHDQYAEVGEN